MLSFDFQVKLKINFFLIILLMELEIFKEKKNKALNKIPAEIMENAFLNTVIEQLPANYNFEIHKSIWRIEELKKSL